MLTYADTITLPDELTLGQAGEVYDYLAQYCRVEWVGAGGERRKKLRFEFRAESDGEATLGDLWDAREWIDEVAETLRSYGIHYEPDRKCVGDDETPDLVARLRRDVSDMMAVPVAAFYRCPGCGRMRCEGRICPTVAEGGQCPEGE